MLNVRTRHDYRGSPDDVWATAKVFGNADMFPEGVTLTEAHGEGVGATRRIELPDGATVTERVESVDDDTRTLRYTIDETTLPFRDYHAVLHVVPRPDGTATLEWSASFEAPPEEAGQLKAELEALFEAILEKGEAAYERAPS